MTEYTIISLFAVLFAYANRFTRNNVALCLSQLIFFIFFALRFEFGNDYVAYSQIFVEIQNSGFDGIYELTEKYDIGWIFLNLIFENLGFFHLIVWTSAATSFVYYFVIRDLVPKAYHWLATFLFAFTPTIALTDASAMRQNMAILFLFMGILSLTKGRKLLGMSFNIIATLFHITAVIGIISQWVSRYCKFDLKFVTRYLCILVVMYLMIPVNSFVLPYILPIFPERFSQYVEAAEINSGLGIINSIVLMFIVLYTYLKFKPANELIAIIFLAKFILIPLNFVLLMAGRLVLYFDPLIIIVFPSIVARIKSPIVRGLLIMYITLTTLFLYYSFFHSDVYSEFYYNYRTIDIE